MPPKNTYKTYVENGHYHLYNRGNNKQTIFLNENDYKYFLYLLKIYLSPPEEVKKILLSKQSINLYFVPNNYYPKLKIMAFCLMPNHFHLLLKQTEKYNIAEFMKSLLTNYVIYFNRKYERCGSLFQSRYKGILLINQSSILAISRYIHLNPKDLNSKLSILKRNWNDYTDYPYSSYRWYLRSNINTRWFENKEILNLFNNRTSLIKYQYSNYAIYVSKGTEDNKKIKKYYLD